MELKNKPGTFLERFINNRNVNKHRKLVLKINYLKGLAYEYGKKYDDYIQKETKLIEGYYAEDMAPLTDQLGGLTSVDIKRNKKIASYDKKQYWLRRKYKTKVMRSEDKTQLESLLKTWDKEQLEKRNQFIEKTTEKYLHVKDVAEETRRVEAKVEALDNRKKEQFEKMEIKGTKIQKNVKMFLKKNAQKIEKMENENERLTNLIIKFNKNRHQEDQKLLDKYKPKLAELKKLQLKGDSVNEKQVEKLEVVIDKVETVMKMIENDHIHLSVSHLKMFFGGIKAINDLSFDVYKGEIFGLIGPNGAGKTTIFNCITQFYKATSGNMILRNKENHIVSLYDYKTHNMIKEGIARSFQNVELIWELTVLDNLMVAAHSLLITSFTDHMAHTRKLLREDTVIRTKGYNVLKNLGIEEYAFRSPYGLPYGVLKKIELARTLMTDPSLIILDEPAAGLNDAETKDLASVIKKVNKEYGVTIFLVEHDMGLVMSICDRICAISFGKRIGLGTPKEIQSNPEVRKAYLGDDDDE
jgi:ABC-type branched-subunit amino acid transport system ATPase component